VTCRACGGGRCCDGYTEFCCTINGGSNSCPPGSFVGGWWKCSDYTGHRLCATQGVRYYLDCNRLPGHRCPQGRCTCANGSCSNRATCCNVFRYGQCNTQIGGVTEVVCRVVKCVNPCRTAPSVCSCTTFYDNATCAHEAACLVPGPPPPPPVPKYHPLGFGGGGGYG
jgi:hypothetical protein